MSMRGFFTQSAPVITAVALLAVLCLVGERTGLWIICILLALCALTLATSLVRQIRRAAIRPAYRRHAKDYPLKILATLMGLLLTVGTSLYLHVFYTLGHDPALYTGHPVRFSNVEYLLRSLICALDLFMLDVDSNLLDRLDGQATLKGWLSLQAVVSFACTVAMLAGLVYSRLRAYFRLNYLTRISDRRNHLYLFFSNNIPSGLLIKDIVRNDSKALAIIIDEANIHEDEHDEWQGIVGLVAHNKKIFRTAAGIGAHVAIASRQPCDICDEVDTAEDFDVLGCMGLPKIRKFIRQLAGTDSPQLHIFFMGEDEDRNIRNISALAKDITLTEAAAAPGLRHCIYCHSRYNGPNRVIEDIALRRRLNVRIVDSSHLAVEILKQDSAHHPVNVVEFSTDRPATAASPLKTLIVGFGEVGRDAFRFLYEFGAFGDSSAPGHRSPFECVIADGKLDSIKGAFMASMPAIFHRGKDNPHIRLLPVDSDSAEFYTDVLTDDFCREVNYIVISINDSDEAIALATSIFSRVRRVRADLSHLRIYVRCTDDAKAGYARNIADLYNFGYGAGPANTPVIHIFGQPSHTYTYDLVVSDRLIEEGKRFHERYRLLSGEGKTWDERRAALTRHPSDLDNIRRLRRQESQSLANALHAGTKMALLRQAIGVSADFYDRYFRPDGSVNTEGHFIDIRYPGLTSLENTVIRHLAMLEHLRWTAAHELMGYMPDDDSPECDERTMSHGCICPWDTLDTRSRQRNDLNHRKGEDWTCDYKKYDFGVVDTTIALARAATSGGYTPHGRQKPKL